MCYHNVIPIQKRLQNLDTEKRKTNSADVQVAHFRTFFTYLKAKLNCSRQEKRLFKLLNMALNNESTITPWCRCLLEIC
jgi:hypothetical protein